MDNIEKIKLLRENVRDNIQKELNSLVCKFKKYVSVEHVDDPKWTVVEGMCNRINYGIKNSIYPDMPEISENKEDDNYFYFLPNTIQFIHRYKLCESNLIFYNNKSKLWFVSNKKDKKFSLTKIDMLEFDDVKKFIEFVELDTDTQILFLEQLENILK